MKGMASAQEFQQPPPPGTYWSVIVTAEAQFANSGASMIKLAPSIDDQRYPAFKGVTCDDYIITDGTAKGGGMGKTKLRGAGIDVDSSDAELPDEVICAQLTGKGLWVTYGNEQRMTRANENGPYDQPMTVVDPRNGAVIKLMKLNVKGYSIHNIGQAQAPAAPAQQQHAAPAAPQGGFAPAPGFAAPQATQYAQPPAQQTQQQFAPQQAQPFVQQNPMQGQPFQPQQQAPQYQPVPQQPQYAQPGIQPAQPLQQAAPPWAGQPPPNGAPPAAAKPRKPKLQVDPNAQPVDPNAPQG